jgi:hypothetical protein
MFRCLERERGVNHIGPLRHHPLASPAVMVGKVVGRDLFLNIISNNFTAGSRQKVWCDQGMREMLLQERWTSLQCCAR